MPVLPAVASTMVPPGFQPTFRFGPQDDSDGGAVFHAAARIQVFELGVDVGRTGGNQFFQSQDRSVADQLGDVVGDAQAASLGFLGAHPTEYGSGAGASMMSSGLTWCTDDTREIPRPAGENAGLRDDAYRRRPKEAK